MDYRIEKDSLGEMRVPSDALYGAQTQRAVLNFPISGMRPYPAFVWAMATIKRAAAEVNRDLGLLDELVKSGRTHLQDAVPVRLGQEFGAYARAVANDRERIAIAGDRLRRLGIGGTATGTGLNAHPEYHARMVKRLSELTNQDLR